MQSPFFSPTHDFLNYAVLTSKINVLVIQANYLLIPSHTCVWVCNGKQSCFVFCGNLIREECWKHGAGWERTLSLAPHPTAWLPARSCASGMWQQPPSSMGRVERCLLDLGTGSLALWLNQSCLHGRFFWLLLGDHPITYLLPIKSGWVAHGWKGFQGCRALQAFACHVGVKPWTLFSSSVTLIKSRQAGRIWLGMLL